MGDELDYGDRIPAIVISSQLNLPVEADQKQYHNNPAPTSVLDELFRNALREIWNM
jgi:hypothetical protein